MLALPSRLTTTTKTLLSSHLLSSRIPKMDFSGGQAQPIRNNSAHHHQHVLVMRHGDRIDNFQPRWIKNSSRPWDPPLIEEGRVRAFCKGTKLRSDLGFPIHRVFVSPFVRCVQTAVQVVTALAAKETPSLNKYDSRNPLPVDPSKVKVSIEYGLCEMINKEAIRGDVAPKDGNWGFNISELEATFPEGMVDRTVERIYKELPQWGESVMDARGRYAKVVQALADKHPMENLLLVTHGEGVGSSISYFLEGATVYEAEYCAYSELRRSIFYNESNDQAPTAGKFEVITNLGQTVISYSLEM